MDKLIIILRYLKLQTKFFLKALEKIYIYYISSGKRFHGIWDRSNLKRSTSNINTVQRPIRIILTKIRNSGINSHIRDHLIHVHLTINIRGTLASHKEDWSTKSRKDIFILNQWFTLVYQQLVNQVCHCWILMIIVEKYVLELGKNRSSW